MKTAESALSAANAVVPKISVADGIQKHADGNSVFIDVRDGLEIQETGTIQGALKIPRGFIEFAADSSTPYHEEKLQKDVSGKGLKGALITIIIADISMSLDNVIAITSIARDNKTLLVLGIAFAILIMALFATAIVKLLTKFKWLSYLGLAFLVYLSSKMTLDGWLQIYPYINDYL